MTADEVDAFLTSAQPPLLLKLATVNAESWPVIVPLWYLWRGGAFWLVGRRRSEWVKDLERDARCAVCVEEPAHPRIRKVLAQCTAEIVEGPCEAAGSAWLEVANEMARRYLGSTGPDQLRPTHGWERYLVKLSLRAGRLRTWQGGSWARRYLEADEGAANGGPDQAGPPSPARTSRRGT